MQEFLAYQRRIMALVAITIILGCVVCLVWLSGHASWLGGWALGGVVGLAVFRLRVGSVLALEHLPQEQWKSQSVKSGMLGMGLLVAGGVVAILFKQTIEPWAYLAGAVVERVVLVLDSMVRPVALCPVAAEEAAELDTKES